MDGNGRAVGLYAGDVGPEDGDAGGPVEGQRRTGEHEVGRPVVDVVEPGGSVEHIVPYHAVADTELRQARVGGNGNHVVGGDETAAQVGDDDVGHAIRPVEHGYGTERTRGGVHLGGNAGCCPLGTQN